MYRGTQPLPLGEELEALSASTVRSGLARCAWPASLFSQWRREKYKDVVFDYDSVGRMLYGNDGKNGPRGKRGKGRGVGGPGSGSAQEPKRKNRLFLFI
jgi:hypothetical protein